MTSYESGGLVLRCGDAFTLVRGLAVASIRCVVTSPPYWGLRDYDVAGQFGHEATLTGYVEKLVSLGRDLKRPMTDDATLWLNLGDCYVDKQLMGVPWQVARALQADGWLLRDEIIWSKTNPTPESVTDRFTRSHEHVFHFAQSKKYFHDADAVREPPAESTVKRIALMESREAPEEAGAYKAGQGKMASRGQHADHLVAKPNPLGRNKRSVWTMASALYKGAHFAPFPKELAETCIKAGSQVGDTILDPFCGAATTLIVAEQLGRKAIGIELNPDFCALAVERIKEECAQFRMNIG